MTIEDNKTFRVVLEGRVREGEDLEVVKNRLARLFKQDPSKMNGLLSGRSFSVKGGLDRETAGRIAGAIRGAGAAVRVEEEWSPCPKCGYVPRTSEDDLILKRECPACGIVVDKYLKYRSETQEPAASLPAGDEPSRGAAPGAAGGPPPEEAITIELSSGFFQTLLSLEFTLPDSIRVPREPDTRPTAGLGQRFFAGLATCCAWIFVVKAFELLLTLPVVLFLALFTSFRFTHGNIADLRGIFGLLAVLYALVYLPARWHGVTYGQRMFGILPAPNGPGPGTLGTRGVLMRFLGLLVHAATFGLSILFPLVHSQRKNVPDLLSSSRQLDMRTGEPDSFRSSVNKALLPFLIAIILHFCAVLVLGGVMMVLKPFQGRTTSVARTVQQKNPFQAAREAGESAFDRPSRPTGRMSSLSMTPREILQRISLMEAIHLDRLGHYTGDFEELFMMFGMEFFPPNDPLIPQYRNGRLKMRLTPSGFEIGLQRENTWHVTSERGYQGERKEF